MNAIIFEHLYYKLTIKDIIVLPISIHFLIIYNLLSISAWTPLGTVHSPVSDDIYLRATHSGYSSN